MEVRRLRPCSGELRVEDVRGLALFGSVARGDSDVDLLIDLDRQATLGFGIVRLREELRSLLGREVGLSFASRIAPEFRRRIAPDLVRLV